MVNTLSINVEKVGAHILKEWDWYVKARPVEAIENYVQIQPSGGYGRETKLEFRVPKFAMEYDKGKIVFC